MSPTPAIFFGSPPEVIPILKSLIDNPDINLLAVVTQPDRPVGRKKILTPTAVKKFALENHLLTLTPYDLTEEFLWELKNLLNSSTLAPSPSPLVPDLAVLAAYGQILPHHLLTYPKYGFINLHPSLLPQYRGATPTVAPILKGEATTGLTFMHMDEAMDHGPIIAQFNEAVFPNDTRDTLTSRLFQKAAPILPKVIEAYLNFKKYTLHTSNGAIEQGSGLSYQLSLPPTEQSHSQATFTKLLNRHDGFISWQLLELTLNGQPAPLDLFPPKLQALIADLYQPEMSSTFLERLIRALSPWPGVWTTLPNSKLETRLPPEALAKEGNSKLSKLKILSAHLENNNLIPDQVRPEGKSTTTWENFQATSAS